MIRALIVEDETAAAVNLRAILRETAPDVEIVATLESVTESVDYLRAHPQPDLLFMDIHLADGDSFRIFDAVEIVAPVIFTTAYDRYALDAFKVSGIDYLLKPLNGADVRRAIDKFRRLTGSERHDYGARVQAMASGREETFLVHVRDRIIPLHRDKIAYCYTSNEKVTPCRAGYRRVVRQPPGALLTGAYSRADYHFEGPGTRVQGVAAVGSPRRIVG